MRLGWALAYLFYNGWRNSYERLTQAALSRTGHLPQTVFDPAANRLFTNVALAAVVAEQPVVKGPAAIVVGEGVNYKATLAGVPAAACTWAVEPADAGTVSQEAAPKLR